MKIHDDIKSVKTTAALRSLFAKCEDDSAKLNASIDAGRAAIVLRKQSLADYIESEKAAIEIDMAIVKQEKAELTKLGNASNLKSRFYQRLGELEKHRLEK